MNSVKDFSIPCLLSKNELENIRKRRKQNRQKSTTHRNHMCTESVHPKPHSTIPSATTNSRVMTVLSLNSDEVIKDSRFHENISCSPSHNPSMLGSKRFVHIVKPTIPPLKIKRTLKVDGTFDYHVHKQEETTNHIYMEQQFYSGSPGDPIIVDLSCSEDQDSGLDCPITAVSLEWMDKESPPNSPLLNNETITLISDPEDCASNVPRYEAEPRKTDLSRCSMLSISRKRKLNSTVQVSRQYRNKIPSGDDPAHVACATSVLNNSSQCVVDIDRTNACSTQELLVLENNHITKRFQNGLSLTCNRIEMPSEASSSNSEKEKCTEPKVLQAITNGELSTSLDTTSPLVNGTCLNKQPVSDKPRKSVCITNSELYESELHKWETSLNSKKQETDAWLYVENTVDQVVPPLSFNYISQSIYSKGIPLPDPTALFGCCCVSCKDTSKCCPQMAGHKFPYYRNGKLRVGFGTPIYECNSMCRCGKDCLNRVVQRGSQYPLCIFRTVNGRGWGVKTRSLIEKGKFVTEYVGELITSEEAEKRGKEYDKEGSTYLFDLDFCDNAEFTIDATLNGNVSHFLNHSCDPNLAVFSVWIDTLDIRLPHLALFARRDIQKGEELTFDYQMNHNMASIDMDKRTPCLCGTKKCRGFLF